MIRGTSSTNDPVLGKSIIRVDPASVWPINSTTSVHPHDPFLSKIDPGSGAVTLIPIETIENCSVLSVGHKLYEEEVFAFIVLKKGIRKNISTAKVILKKINLNLAFFKLPCYIRFIDKLPLFWIRFCTDGAAMAPIEKPNKLILLLDQGWSSTHSKAAATWPGELLIE